MARKRRSLKVSLNQYKKAREDHGIGLSILIRMALAGRPSLETLKPYFPPPSTEVQLQLSDRQWQRINEISQQAQQAGLAKTQADVLRALADYQLDKIGFGGAPPGG